MAKQKQDISRIWGERTRKHRAFKPHKPFPVMHHTSHGLLNLKIVFPNLLFCKPKWERWGFFFCSQHVAIKLSPIPQRVTPQPKSRRKNSQPQLPRVSSGINLVIHPCCLTRIINATWTCHPRCGDAARILHERSWRETWAPQRRLVPRKGLALAQGRAARVAVSSWGAPSQGEGAWKSPSPPRGWQCCWLRGGDAWRGYMHEGGAWRRCTHA